MFVDCINSWAKIKSEKQYLTITWSHLAAGKLDAAQAHSRGNTKIQQSFAADFYFSGSYCNEMGSDDTEATVRMFTPHLCR